jgi:hypothetical protein
MTMGSINSTMSRPLIEKPCLALAITKFELRAPHASATRNRWNKPVGSQNWILTFDTGGFTVRRARLALVMTTIWAAGRGWCARNFLRRCYTTIEDRTQQTGI